MRKSPRGTVTALFRGNCGHPCRGRDSLPNRNSITPTALRPKNVSQLTRAKQHEHKESQFAVGGRAAGPYCVFVVSLGPPKSPLRLLRGKGRLCCKLASVSLSCKVFVDAFGVSLTLANDQQLLPLQVPSREKSPGRSVRRGRDLFANFLRGALTAIQTPCQSLTCPLKWAIPRPSTVGLPWGDLTDSVRETSLIQTPSSLPNSN